MDDEEIKNVHRYLMNEWQINKKSGPRGPIGPCGAKGQKGDAGSGGIDDMCRWMPKLVLENFPKDKLCCFTLADPSKDLLKGAGGAYTTWISRSNAKINTVAIYPSKHVLHLKNTHNALAFENSLYRVDVIISPLSYTSSHNYSCVCIMFQVDGKKINFFSLTGKIGQLHFEVFLLPAKRFVYGG